MHGAVGRADDSALDAQPRTAGCAPILDPTALPTPGCPLPSAVSYDRSSRAPFCGSRRGLLGGPRTRSRPRAAPPPGSSCSRALSQPFGRVQPAFAFSHADNCGLFKSERRAVTQEGDKEYDRGGSSSWRTATARTDALALPRRPPLLALRPAPLPQTRAGGVPSAPQAGAAALAFGKPPLACCAAPRGSELPGCAEPRVPCASLRAPTLRIAGRPERRREAESGCRVPRRRGSARSSSSSRRVCCPQGRARSLPEPRGPRRRTAVPPLPPRALRARCGHFLGYDLMRRPSDDLK